MEKLVVSLPLCTFICGLCVFIFSLHFNFRQIISAVFLLVWSSRLFGHLLIRMLTEKYDSRFDSIRAKAWKRATFYALQAIQCFCYAFPATLLQSINPSEMSVFSVFDLIGTTIALFGLLMETVADIQLYAYIHEPIHYAHYCDKGIYQYIRHPNYLGNIMLLGGLFLLCCSSLIRYEWLVALCPVFNIVCLLFVTGIPPTERALRSHYERVPTFSNYIKSTGKILPPISAFRRNKRSKNKKSSIQLQSQERVSPPTTKFPAECTIPPFSIDISSSSTSSSSSSSSSPLSSSPINTSSASASASASASSSASTSSFESLPSSMTNFQQNHKHDSLYRSPTFPSSTSSTKPEMFDHLFTPSPDGAGGISN
eukprot:MONOS_596.1-p1 / transcript=MONOS_596.1 / gene=MONOS_596 / organism=Monocercomonoides_exilis_PA203 / gene_product=GI12913 / transcript_product=GI12913 / location=Mono_scaffold00009:219838-221191(-) / protein_length=368 / sequence_SO=supercontig / SO=protein_coding / is_pseudo=false